MTATANTTAAAHVLNYNATGTDDEYLGTVDADTYARYLAEIGDDDVGAVDGGPYGFEGYTVYMQD